MEALIYTILKGRVLLIASLQFNALAHDKCLKTVRKDWCLRASHKFIVYIKLIELLKYLSFMEETTSLVENGSHINETNSKSNAALRSSLASAMRDRN